MRLSRKQKTFRKSKIRRKINNGKLKAECLPPEEYRIERDATSLDDAKFHAHIRTVTRSDLIKWGYDKKIVEQLPTFQETDDEGFKQERHSSSYKSDGMSEDRSTDEIEIAECYIMADLDGDGIAEWNCVVTAPGSQGRQVLEHYEVNEHPFNDFTPERVPHRWQGRSIADVTMDQQKIKTALLRAFLDNLYLQNFPQKVIIKGQVENLDEVVNPTLGGVIIAKNVGAVTNLETPFAAKESLTGLEYCDQIIQKRTGISRQTMQLDPEALQNQSATAAQIGHDAAYSRTELIARNFANSLERFFAKMLRLVIENQDQADIIRLRDTFVEMNPQSWTAEMDVTIDVGLGTGSRDRDMSMLNLIASKQEQIILQAGQDNPLAGLQEYRNTLVKMVEAGGGRSPEMFFKEVTPESLAQFQQAQSQKPDPEMAKLQGQMQAEQARSQSNLQIKTQETQARFQLDSQQHAADIQTMQDKAKAELVILQQKASLEAQLKREELAQEAQLKREAMLLDVQARSHQTNIEAQNEL